MALTQSQRAIVEKARSVGGGRQGIALDEAECALLVAIIARDLGYLDRLPELPPADAIPELLAPASMNRHPGLEVGFLPIFERLLGIDPNCDMYFSCLATLHKSRIKYERILETQPIPTIDQIGPRGLLEYGKLSAKALTTFLSWRKWMYDIDNRAAQETGYLFQPIIANAIGGTSASAAQSPIRRHRNVAQGRQVDCIRESRAYEIKIRVTIAASGQGRWGEELEYPIDCQSSGYIPVLVVLDPTPNAKLRELARAFRSLDGEVYIGADAWKHLEGMAGPTMARFLEKYVRDPIDALLADVPGELPDVTFHMNDASFTVSIGLETFSVKRAAVGGSEAEDGPGDAD